jgi:hypothetical protein
VSQRRGQSNAAHLPERLLLHGWGLRRRDDHLLQRDDCNGAIVPIVIAALVFAVAWWQTRRVRRSHRPVTRYVRRRWSLFGPNINRPPNGERTNNVYAAKKTTATNHAALPATVW